MASNYEKIKWIEDLPFMVDGFQFAPRRDGVTHFLTHFHSDHYWGLRSSWHHGEIYCSEVTAALVVSKLRVDRQFVRPLPLNQAVVIQGVEVTAVDANHCPGAIMLLFRVLRTGRTILHTGDFRASPELRRATAALLSGRGLRGVDCLYLDTTYANAKYVLPPQEEALSAMAAIARRELARDASVVFCVGTYSLGKERAVRAVAQAVGSRAYARPNKEAMLRLAGVWDERVFSGEQEGCRVRMAWLGQLRMEKFRRLSKAEAGEEEEEEEEEEEVAGREEPVEVEGPGAGEEAAAGARPKVEGDEEEEEEERAEEEAAAAIIGQAGTVVGFRPTGWSLTRNRKGPDGKPLYEPWVDTSGRHRMYFVPYSEHSSFDELRDFVRAVRPRRLVPTVGVGGDGRRLEAVRRIFLSDMDLSQDRGRIDFHMMNKPQQQQQPGSAAASPRRCSSASAASSTSTAEFDLCAVDVDQQLRLWEEATRTKAEARNDEQGQQAAEEGRRPASQALSKASSCVSEGGGKRNNIRTEPPQGKKRARRKGDIGVDRSEEAAEGGPAAGGTSGPRGRGAITNYFRPK